MLIRMKNLSRDHAPPAAEHASSRLGSRRAGSFDFIVPTSALLFSWFFLGDVPGVSTVAGGVLTVSAVYLINRKGSD